MASLLFKENYKRGGAASATQVRIHEQRPKICFPTTRVMCGRITRMEQLARRSPWDVNLGSLIPPNDADNMGGINARGGP
jgi:hypothetical protein